MQLLKYREKIDTECTLVANPSPKLSAMSIKIDGTPTGLKIWLGCRDEKSCDYFRQNKKNFYFIEISDFYAQFSNLQTNITRRNTTLKTPQEAMEYIFDEIKSKLEGTIKIFEALASCTVFGSNKLILDKKVLLATCSEGSREAVIFATIQRNLEQRNADTGFKKIKFIPYGKLENILKKS